LTRGRRGVTLSSMSPKVGAVLQLVSELTEEERKEVRLQLELEEGATALRRKLPRIAPAQATAIQDELAWRFVHDTAPAVPAEVMMKRARQTLATLRKRRQSPKKK
jgi:hypothetical protein